MLYDINNIYMTEDSVKIHAIFKSLIKIFLFATNTRENEFIFFLSRLMASSRRSVTFVLYSFFLTFQIFF